MLTMDSWFMRISDTLRMKALQELSHTRFIPKLNLKTSEELHAEYEKLKGKKRLSGEDYEA